MSWELDLQVELQVLGEQLTSNLRGLIEADSQQDAYRHAQRIEAAVAPVTGGLAASAGAAIRVIAINLPFMTEDACIERMELLSSIVGTIGAMIEAAEDVPTVEVETLVGLVGTLAERGSAEVQAASVDLISLSATVSPSAAARARHVLGTTSRSSFASRLLRPSRPSPKPNCGP